MFGPLGVNLTIELRKVAKYFAPKRLKKANQRKRDQGVYIKQRSRIFDQTGMHMHRNRVYQTSVKFSLVNRSYQIKA